MADFAPLVIELPPFFFPLTQNCRFTLINCRGIMDKQVRSCSFFPIFHKEVIPVVSERMLGLGTARSVIRELFEYGKQRAAVVGPENVFDFSLGNPSVPAPDAVNETAIRILREQPELIHCYTSAQGDAQARQRFADSLNRRFRASYTADQLYITVGAAASLCCVFGGLTCPEDEFIVFAPYFPEYKVFIEGAGAKNGTHSPGD